MPVGVLFEIEGFTQQTYDAVSEALGSDPPEGALLHIAGPIETGWRVVEVWESEDAQRRFQEGRLNRAFDAVGVPHAAPSFFPVHVMLPPPEGVTSDWLA